MTLQVFDFEGTDGANLTGTGITKSGTGTLAFSAADAIVGGTGGRASASSGSSLGALCAINSSKVQAFDVWLRTPGTPSTGTYALATLRHASGTILTIEYDTTNRIGVFEQAGSNRQVVPSVTMANNTLFRIQILASIGVSTNDSNYTAKVFSSASNWTTQVGTTLTRTGVNLGTVAAVAVFLGALTVATPGLAVGFDYLRVDDGKTTDFTGPPAASAPTAVAGASDLYPLAGDTVSLVSTGSTAGTGTLSYAWTCTAFPAGASSPAISNPATATASFVPSVGSRYTFNLRVTQTGGLFADTPVTVYAHTSSNSDVKVYSVLSNAGWTNEGGAASILAALNDDLSSTYAQSPVAPSGQLCRVVMDPYGPGSISVLVAGNWTGGTLTRTVKVYLEDGVTLLQTDTYALTSVETEREIVLDAGDLIAASAGSGRRALVVDWSDA